VFDKNNFVQIFSLWQQSNCPIYVSLEAYLKKMSVDTKILFMTKVGNIYGA